MVSEFFVGDFGEDGDFSIHDYFEHPERALFKKVDSALDFLNRARYL
jgi:hypothetical protein